MSNRIVETAPGNVSHDMNEPRQLWPDDVDHLHLEHHSRLTADHVVELLGQCPGASFWLPNTSEVILGTPWRRRSELVTAHSFGAFGNEDVLLQSAMTLAGERGSAGFVVVDTSETRQPSYYARHGLRRLENIVTFEHKRPASLASASIGDDIEFVRVDGSDADLLGDVQDLDHAAFPWFWWNSQEEFDFYLRIPGVELWAGIRNREVVTYAGMTRHQRWAHLDRIATRPSLQGMGLGRATLIFAVRMMVQQGCREVVLSTQGNNPRSRRLYQQTGFVRTPSDDYSIFVAPFDESRVYAGILGREGTPLASGDRTSS